MTILNRRGSQNEDRFAAVNLAIAFFRFGMMKDSMMKHRPLYRTFMALAMMLLILVTSLLSACSEKPKSSIIVAGSTSVQPFAEILAEEFMKLHPDITIDIQGGGSSAGIKAAESNTADIGMSSRDLKGDEKNLWSVEIARDGLAVIVNPENPLQGLSINQIRDIYSTALNNWSQMGGPSSGIHVFTREEGSGTRDAFSKLVMEKIEITPKALVQDSNGAVRQLVADDPAAIGYISLGLVNDKVKALHLDGITANHENIINGSYKLARPFLFVANTEPTGNVKLFTDFVLSEEGRKILGREGLVTLGSGGQK